MSLDNEIEIKKEVLYQAIKSNGLLDEKTIKVSEELDRLIVRRMGLRYREVMQ
jgi:hypothetical protein